MAIWQAVCRQAVSLSVSKATAPAYVMMIAAGLLYRRRWTREGDKETIPCPAAPKPSWQLSAQNADLIAAVTEWESNA